MGAPRFVMEDFWPSDLFLGGIPGAWYDPTDLSTMFQDSTGTTPVTAVEQPVGLILDKSQGLALGVELVTNGDFSGGTTGWSVSAGGSIAVVGGKLQVTSAGGGVYYVTQSFATTVGKTYRMQGTIAKLAPAFTAIRKSDNATASANVVNLTTALGSASGVFVATSATTFIVLQANGLGPGDSAEFDDISIRELAGNHASQSTAASRPTYRARYNLLTFSEEFQNAAYSKQASVTITADSSIAPDGTTTADTFASSSAVGNYGFFQLVTGLSGVSYTASIYAKAGTATSFVFGMTTQGETAICYYTFNVSAGTAVVANVGGFTSTSATITAVGNGWYRCVVTGTTPAGTTNIGIFPRLPAVANILIWGAQLLTAADVTATGNAYQRIAAATVYDTAPIFRPYLAFDGVDDSLATAAINFTTTDKMTVFAGVTKLSDTSGTALELSANANTNAGSFSVFAPGFWAGTIFGKYFCGLNASTPLYADLTNYPSPDTSVLTFSFNNSAATAATQLVPRVDAASPTISYNAANAGTGNFGNYPLFIGRRNNASFPFNGRIYELIVRGAASSVTEIADTELWVNARTGGY